MASPIHHINKRKRIHYKKETYPHPNKWIRFLDKFLIFVAIIGPLVAIPQLIKIYYFKNAVSLSLLTWGLLVIGNIPWIIYGLVHKEKPIIIGYSRWFIVNLSIVIGILLYG